MRNLTPAHLRCGPLNCPAVYELEDGSIAIIGRKGPRDPMSGKSYFGHPIGEDEELVIIDKALLATIRDEVREECAKALELSASMSPFPSKYAEAVDAIRALKETPHE